MSISARSISILNPCVDRVRRRKVGVRHYGVAGRCRGCHKSRIPLDVLTHLTAGREDTDPWITRELGSHVEMSPAGTCAGNIDRPGWCIPRRPTHLAPANTFGSEFAE